jgi:hypothetical protein
MAKGVAYKYEPQLDLDVSVKKPGARALPGSALSLQQKKATAKAQKALALPMSMDEFEFGFVDDLYGSERSAAAAVKAAAAASAITAQLFDVPDDLFKDEK